MGLFNSGKNEKVEKVSKYERHYNVPEKSSHQHHRRSSKVRQHEHVNGNRAMSQPPPFANIPNSNMNYYQGLNNRFNPTMFNNFTPNMFAGQIRYPIVPFDLSKYPFQQQQQQQQQPIYPSWNTPQASMWPIVPPASNYPYLGNMQF